MHYSISIVSLALVSLCAADVAHLPSRTYLPPISGAAGYSGIGYSGSGAGYSGAGYSGVGYSGAGYSGAGHSGVGGYSSYPSYTLGSGLSAGYYSGAGLGGAGYYSGTGAGLGGHYAGPSYAASLFTPAHKGGYSGVSQYNNYATVPSRAYLAPSVGGYAGSGGFGYNSGLDTKYAANGGYIY